MVIHIEFDGVMSLLRLALRNVAADADAQIERLVRLRIDCDDLGESVSDAYRASRPMLTPIQSDAVSAVDELFAGMTAEDNVELWTDEALKNAPQGRGTKACD